MHLSITSNKTAVGLSTTELKRGAVKGRKCGKVSIISERLRKFVRVSVYRFYRCTNIKYIHIRVILNIKR